MDQWRSRIGVGLWYNRLDCIDTAIPSFVCECVWGFFFFFVFLNGGFWQLIISFTSRNLKNMDFASLKNHIILYSHFYNISYISSSFFFLYIKIILFYTHTLATKGNKKICRQTQARECQTLEERENKTGIKEVIFFLQYALLDVGII